MTPNIALEPSLVSVIIPTYNRPKYLKQAIESAVNQTYKNIEIIVADDGSPESPQSIIESFNDARIRLIRHPENIGIAMNVIGAFKEAKGKYVASLNDDDIWTEDFLAKLVPHLENNPNLVLAFSDHYIMDENSNIDDAATEKNSQRWKRDQLVEGIYQPFDEIALVHQSIPSAVATVIRKNAIAWDKFLPQMGPCWDLYLTYLACISGKGAYYVPEKLSKYRVHSKSESMISGKQNAQAKIRASKAGIFCYQQFMADERIKEFKRFFQKKCLHAYTTLAIGLLRAEQVVEARQYLWYALSQQKFNLRTMAALAISFTPQPIARKLLTI
jgi:glycosyltransferase involved in cell wall biosynthesis